MQRIEDLFYGVGIWWGETRLRGAGNEGDVNHFRGVSPLDIGPIWRQSPEKKDGFTTEQLVVCWYVSERPIESLNTVSMSHG